ncbi:MAG: hypothetical protein M3Q36_03185 [bacterium]|nr:hypothetical protein [bacterium]
MRGKKAYFTPGIETVGVITNSLLFGASENRPKLSFLVDKYIDSPADSMPDLEEIVLEPVSSVCVGEEGFEISGRLKDNPTVVGQLAVNTTVEPPLAFYREYLIEPADC